MHRRSQAQIRLSQMFSFGFLFHTLAILITSFALTGCKFQFGWGYNQGHSPTQPIPFDHSLHAGKGEGQVGLQCQYCHNQIERTTNANIPALSTCMNCHLVVKTDSPHIQRLREAYDKNESIPWVKVHMLPDHAKFNHAAHLAKGVNCQTCHGPVETMKQVYQFSDLSMGWCVNCHREPDNKAPLNCSTCHF